MMSAYPRSNTDFFSSMTTQQGNTIASDETLIRTQEVRKVRANARILPALLDMKMIKECGTTSQTFTKAEHTIMSSTASQRRVLWFVIRPALLFNKDGSFQI